MKKTKKFLLSALACLTAGVSVLGASSCALHDSIHDFVRPACGKAFLWKTDGSLYYKLSIDQKSFSVVAINNIDGKTELSIPSSYQGRPITAIDEKVFQDAEDLVSVTIGNNVKTIGENAFLGCDKLESVTLGSAMETIGKDAFFGCNSLKEFNASSSRAFTDIDGHLYTKDEKTLLLYAPANEAVAYNIPETVVYVSDCAFYNCDNLETVNVPDSVNYIGAFAFYGCDGLQEVEIGKSVSNIGENAFTSCDKLEKITVAGDNSAYQDVDGNLYTKGTKTLLAYAVGKTDATFVIPDGVRYIAPYAVWDADYLERVELPESLMEIGDHAFQGSESLTEILVGKNLTTVWDYAFYKCSALKTVYYTGSAMDWRGVTVLFANDAFTQARVSYNSHR